MQVENIQGLAEKEHCSTSDFTKQTPNFCWQHQNRVSYPMQEKLQTLQGATEESDGKHGQEEFEPKSNNLVFLMTTESGIQNTKAQQTVQRVADALILVTLKCAHRKNFLKDPKREKHL